MSSVAPTHAGTLIGVTELDEEALVARAQAQFVRAAATAQQRDVGQEAAADTAAAHSTPSGITATMEGDGSAPPWIEGEQGRACTVVPAATAAPATLPGWRRSAGHMQ